MGLELGVVVLILVYTYSYMGNTKEFAVRQPKQTSFGEMDNH